MKDGIKRYDYFELQDYLHNIKISDDVKYHLDDITDSTNEFFNRFKGFSDEEVDYYLLKTENYLLHMNKQNERSNINSKDLIDNNLVFNQDNISEDGIKRIHEVLYPECPSEYRDTENRTGSVDIYGNEYVTGFGPYAKDVPKYMAEIIKIFKDEYSYDCSDNPYVASIILNLLISKIQPFKDGNKRTARVIQNLKFTDKINEYYGSNLKLSPVNISGRVLEYTPLFNKRFNNVEFNLEKETNDAINAWIDFHLNMVDDQLYFLNNNIKQRNSIYQLTLNDKHYGFTDENINKGTEEIKRRLH